MSSILINKVALNEPPKANVLSQDHYIAKDLIATRAAREGVYRLIV